MATAQAQIDARKAALASNALRFERLRALHAGIADDIERNPAVGAELVERARQRVTQWAEASTCSPFYIRAWRRILRSRPESGLRKLVLGRTGIEDAMLQNSPFSFVMAEVRRAAPNE